MVKLSEEYARTAVISQRTITVGNSGTRELGTSLQITRTQMGAASEDVAEANSLNPGAAINGTLFTGASNITTATWGQPRNITINGVTKSVNGSADVTWTLAELTPSGDGALERNDMSTVAWTFNSGTGTRDYTFNVPSGWAIGNFRLCVVSGNGSARYYVCWVPWSDMLIGSLGVGGTHAVMAPIGNGSVATLYRVDVARMSIRLPATSDRIIKVWLERIGDE